MKFTIPGNIPRAALITGGVQQSGIVSALANAGFAIALQCHPGAEPDLPAKVTLLRADLCDESQTAALLRRASAALGPIGVLVNAADAREGDTWDATTRGSWDAHMATNLRAPLILIQHFAKALPSPHEGVAINLLDQRICPHLLSYTLSKAALWSLTQTMALALAPRIRVNGIVCGPALKSSGDRPTRQPDDRTGLDEAGRAALAILALASMTGQMIVPGGVPPPRAG